MVLTSLLLAKCLLGKIRGSGWLFRKVIKELKALAGRGGANPKTEAGSGLLTGFSSSSNDFPPLAHPPPILLWGAAELPPKPQHLARAGLSHSPRQASPETKPSREPRCRGLLTLRAALPGGSAAAPCCSPVPCPGARLLPGWLCSCHSLLAEELQYRIEEDNESHLGDLQGSHNPLALRWDAATTRCVAGEERPELGMEPSAPTSIGRWQGDIFSRDK